MNDLSTIRGPITHELKCHPEPFQAVKRGDKPFEWRKDDRDYRVGDTLCLREWDPVSVNRRELNGRSSFEIDFVGYTGEEIHCTVTYIIREGFGIPEGYCIMGLSRLEASAGEPVGAGQCDYRKKGCINDGTTINGKWVCKNHIPSPSSAPVELSEEDIERIASEWSSDLAYQEHWARVAKSLIRDIAKHYTLYPKQP